MRRRVRHRASGRLNSRAICSRSLALNAGPRFMSASCTGQNSTGGCRRELCQLRRAHCIVILCRRSMTEDIPHAAAEPIPQIGDNFVRGVTGIARIVAVLDQRQFSILVA